MSAVVTLGQELMHDSISVGAAALAILKREGNRFAALGHEVLSSQDPEAIHQTRVAARRMRAALRCFADFLPKDIAGIDAELKWAFHALGNVRDLDVLIAGLLETCPESHARRSLLKELRERQIAAWDILAATLTSERYTELIGALDEVSHVSARSLAKSAQKPAILIAPRIISEEHEKVWKRVRRADSNMSRGELHQLRKRAKRFRYTLEFFSELYGKPSRWVLRRLKTLQNKLGAFIDASQAIDTMQALLESEALDDQTRQLVNDLIEMHSEGRARALEELREIRRALSRPWRKLRRRMGEVSDAFESQRARERSVQQKRKRSGGEPLVAASAH
jgi:CHAD domain-containing protein